MPLRNCLECGKVYNSPHPSRCPDCLHKAEDEFLKVRNFIKDNPKVSMIVVSEATGVPEDRIMDYLRDGRIETADISGPAIECLRCGKPVYQGKYCPICQNEISSTFRSGTQNIKAKSEEKKSGKPRAFANRYKKGY